ncbi:hypothetical protein [Nitrososphaera viennensis]|uniref:PqqD family protein n=2 Tax=Nitrososphaera viennensis TaxID=1034015 RepID=A0A060HJ32_9ARCH|nr:hypothetical protein [Nitrososphaera viennensis]AIC15533.1 hypothetical protein NVIE_012970 [Nitrososphaera viennensis EN76]UVS70418.1 hypothetical protein NWT39_06435 [Nitrososphaera viennensis]
MTSSDDTAVFVMNPKVVCRRENDQSFTVYNPSTDMITKISPLSKLVLDMLDGSNSVGDVHFAVSEMYGEFSAEGGRQVFLDFLQKLVDRGIIIEQREGGEKKQEEKKKEGKEEVVASQ